MNMVIVNLYPFDGGGASSARELMVDVDIGGPSMVRSAADTRASPSCAIPPTTRASSTSSRTAATRPPPRAPSSRRKPLPTPPRYDGAEESRRTSLLSSAWRAGSLPDVPHAAAASARPRTAREPPSSGALLRRHTARPPGLPGESLGAPPCRRPRRRRRRPRRSPRSTSRRRSWSSTRSCGVATAAALAIARRARLSAVHAVRRSCRRPRSFPRRRRRRVLLAGAS